LFRKSAFTGWLGKILGKISSVALTLNQRVEALFTKPIDFGALRSEIDTRVGRAA
jgi:hypothetical protein